VLHSPAVSARRSNPISDAAHDFAIGRAADFAAVSKPRPRITVNELRVRTNRLAIALAACFEELSALQKEIGAAGVEGPGPLPFRVRGMTATEAKHRAEAPGWASWAD
jgi:hypothetical protein